MTERRFGAALVALAGALALAAGCTDYTPNPVYSHGIAYAPPPCDHCAYGNWYRYHDGQWHVD